ncbi:MAG TPA: D-amino acid dehydrogenase [Alphaproteobacteria bacterium]|nr:D-amino acid dehydrogenase [Alphaproteobacteria bacterium]
MTTVVLGAGIVGVTTAYYLARLGDEVIVVDRQPAVGLETSFANGALVTVSMSDPWAAPGIPALILKHLGREDAPFLLRPRALPAMVGWGPRFLRNCTPARWRENTETILHLAVYSRDALKEVTAETGIAYDHCDRGTLRVYPNAASLAKATKGAQIYRELGQPAELLDADGCIALEPALEPVKHKLAGGMHYTGDLSGDCLRFTQSLALEAEKRGVGFRFRTEVTGFETDGRTVTAVRTDQGLIGGARFVLACGSHSSILARLLNIRLPVLPVKGYSLTLPVGGWNNAPALPIIDDHRKIAVTPLGERIRLAGTAEFTGFDTTPNLRRADMLMGAFKALFPNYPKSGEVQHWQGLRPMTPDGRPILGRTRYSNFYLNTGHGPLGWTLACGSAKALADLMSDGRPQLDLSGFSADRF